MLEPGSLCDVAFRYARWLRETDQWDSMSLFTAVIHPVVGTLAARPSTDLGDIDAYLVRRSFAVAAWDRIEPERVRQTWMEFARYLEAEGRDHQALRAAVEQAAR